MFGLFVWFGIYGREVHFPPYPILSKPNSQVGSDNAIGFGRLVNKIREQNYVNCANSCKIGQIKQTVEMTSKTIRQVKIRSFCPNFTSEIIDLKTC